MLKLMYELFRQEMRTTGRFAGLENLIAFFPPSGCLALIAVGMGLGVAGSFVSIRRFGEART
jgi:cell division transport system permease protein